MTNMSNMYEKEETIISETCPLVGSQFVTVCLPVTVSPYVFTGPTTVQCCGEPVVIPGCECCKGEENGVCKFTISQKLRVDVPVEFGASVNIDETFVDCRNKAENKCETEGVFICETKEETEE